MQKKILVIILTVLVFFAGSMLGFANVFRVDEVVVEASAISEAAKIEAEELRKQLKDFYEKENILFVNEEKAQEMVAAFPHFRIQSFKKDYPDRLVVTITEDAEVYAVKNAENDTYYILGKDATILAIRESPLNRLDGNSNVVIEGLTVTGNKGELASGDVNLKTVLDFCNQMSLRLNGLRDNILAVKVSDKAPQYCITTREGVNIYVTDPEKATLEKADKIAEKYLSLSDEERLRGCILNVDDGDNIIVAYLKEDLLD